jgi:glycosyltransferase involved in cell wall biosynthesis
MQDGPSRIHVASYDGLRMGQNAFFDRRVDRLRVVTLVDVLSTSGGAEHLALLIATRLNRERFASTLCVSRWPPRSPQYREASAPRALEQLDEAGVRLLPLGRRRKVDVRAWARLERFLRRERVHVLHAHKFGSNVWGTLTGRIARVPVVLAHEHTWSYEGKPLRRLLDRELVARGADRLIAVSREDRRRMTAIERIDPNRTLFIPNGVPPLPPSSGRDVRAELGIEPGVPVIGAVGVFRPQKAHHVLLRAVRTLAHEWPSMQVLLAGDGPEQRALERLTGELGIEHAVRFLGHRSDVSDVLRTLDVAVSCSDFEGSPLAVMEYMDAALPVVATAVGGVPDLIESGVHGLLVPPRDPVALAGAIAELLRDPERGRSMGARGRERRRTEFDIDVLVRRLEDLYCELLEERGCPRRRFAPVTGIGQGHA